MSIFGNLGGYINSLFGGSGTTNNPTLTNSPFGQVNTGLFPNTQTNTSTTSGQNSQNSSALDVNTGAGFFLNQPQTTPTQTATFSSSNAANQAQNQITNTMNDGFNYLNQANQYSQEQDFLQSQPPEPPQYQQQYQPTPEDQVIHEGQTQYYSTTTGQPEWLPTSTTGQAPTGYSTQDPRTRTDVIGTVDGPGGIQFKQFSDGTYGRFDLTTGGYSQSNSADFQIAQQYQDANKRLEDLKRGILTPDQQALLDGVKAQWQALIDQQTTINQNITGVQTGWQNLLGMGNNIIGQGVITKTINDGTRRIAELQAKEAMALAQMKQSFQNDDVVLLKNAYDTYTTAQNSIQETLNLMQQKLLQQQNAQEKSYQSYALQQAAKYGDAGILPSDKPWEVDEKKRIYSSVYQNEIKTKSGTVDPFVLDGLLTEYNKTMKPPTYALARAGAQYVAAFWAAVGGNPNIVDNAARNAAAIKAANSALNTQKKQYYAEQKAVNTLKPSIQRLKEFLEPLADTGSPLLNKPLRTFQGQVLGSRTYTAFLQELNGIAQEYTKILSGASASIAGTSVTAVEDVKKYLSEGATLGQINTALDAINFDVNARLAAGQSAISEIEQSIQMIGQNTVPQTNTSGSFTGDLWQ